MNFVEIHYNLRYEVNTVFQVIIDLLLLPHKVTLTVYEDKMQLPPFGNKHIFMFENKN